MWLPLFGFVGAALPGAVIYLIGARRWGWSWMNEGIAADVAKLASKLNRK